MTRFNSLALFLIVILAAFLRLWQINSIPPALNWDEVSMGYNAYSILKTGRDEWEQFLPRNFQSYGEYKLPVTIYTIIPAVSILGLNEFGVRITPAIWGTLTVLFTFFLVRKIFSKKDKIALLSAFFLAISPWHIQLTRGLFEASLAAFFIVLGLYVFLKGLEKNQWFIVSFLLFGLSLYTYNTARLFVPLFLAALFLIYRSKIKLFNKSTFSGIMIFVLFCLSLLPIILGGGMERLKLVSLWDDPGFVLRINEARGNFNAPTPLPKLIHNKATHFILEAGGNYLSHFSPSYLFIKGARHVQHHVQGMGELYWFELPPLLIGILLLLKKRENTSWLLFSWVILAAVPASLTSNDLPHALRNLVVLPSYQIIIAYGIITFFSVWKKKVPNKIFLGSIVVFALAITINFSYYLKLYYRDYAQKYSRDWQYGYKQIVAYVVENQDKYGQVIITREFGEPQMFFLFWSGYDPRRYQKDPNLIRQKAYDWVWVTQFDKYKFPNLMDPGTRFEDFKKTAKVPTLVVGRAGDFPPDQTVLERVNFLNGDPAFEITEIQSL